MYADGYACFALWDSCEQVCYRHLTWEAVSGDEVTGLLTQVYVYNSIYKGFMEAHVMPLNNDA